VADTLVADTTSAAEGEGAPLRRLSRLDRLLPVWIVAAMGIGLGVGRLWPEVARGLDRVQVDTLSVPIAIGLLVMMYPVLAKGDDWYEQRFLPKIGPLALYGLLFTIVMLFALQGDAITHNPADVVRIAAPLVAYFAVMWSASFALGWRLRLPYEQTATLSFTAAGNNFELAIAVAIGVFGATSGEALAGVVGPLIEVPALIALVYVARWPRTRLYPAPTSTAIAVR